MGQQQQKQSKSGELKEVPNENEYFEESHLKSPLVLSTDQILMKFNALNIKDEIENIQSVRNYGKLPILVIHKLLLFMEPIDLVNMCSTCKLFHEVFSSNPFWKDYYNNYYRTKTANEGMNWKKQFYRRFKEEELAEHKMRRKYQIESVDLYRDENKVGYRITSNNSSVFNIFVIGSENIGKKSFVCKFSDVNYWEETRRRFRGGVDLLDQPEGVDDLLMLVDGVPKKSQTENVKGCVFELIPNSYMFEDRKTRMVMLHILKFNEIEKYLPYGKGILLCFDVSQKKSFEYIKNFMDTQEKSFGKNVKVKESKSMKNVKNRRKPIVVVGLKSDLPDNQRDVSSKEVIEFVKSNNLKGFVESSSKNGCNINLPCGVILDKIQQKEELFLLQSRRKYGGGGGVKK